MKPLFDEKAQYTDIALEIEQEVFNTLNPLMDSYIEAGYSPKELNYLISAALFKITNRESIKLVLK